MKAEIELTADGSYTLYRKDIDEHYHSVKGALEESAHVYLNLGWRHYIEKEGLIQSTKIADHRSVTVFEVGFGTGLNAALASVQAYLFKIPTVYYSVELYPLDPEVIERYIEKTPRGIQTEMKDVNLSAWEIPTVLNPYFTLVKLKADFLKMRLPNNPDIVFFDAFAPEKQPEMWSREVFARIFEAMSCGGVLTTYCAKGTVRRLLLDVGFVVERLPGPTNGKREVLRATKARFLKFP